MEKDLDRPRSGEYLCGQCFAHHQPNDVLFAASRFSKNCDMRQAAHRYAFAGREDYEAWCRKGKSRVLLDWQDLPASHWKIEEGVLRQVQDTTGEWSTQRVCPSCHSLLENVQGRLLIGWSAQGMDMTGAAQVLQQAAGSEGWQQLDPPKKDTGGALEYARFSYKSKNMVLAVPVGLQDKEGSYVAACMKRCGQSAAGAVLKLSLPAVSELEPQQQLEVGEAQDTLSGFLEFAGYVGRKLSLPTVVLIEGLEPGTDAKQLLQQHGVQLFNRLQICLDNPLLLRWDQNADAARQAGDWLVNRLTLQTQ